MRSLIHPGISDIPTLKKIWRNGFPEDADSYCDFYFERYFHPESCLAVYNGKEIESAIYWFDAYYKGIGGNIYDFLFLYAGTTLPEYRGHNNLQYMVEGCYNYAVQKGKTGIVFAAADDLVHLYDRWGYKRIAKLHTYSLKAIPKDNGIFWNVCQFKKFQILRKDYLDSLGNCFYWYERTEKYMFDDIFTKGGVLVCEYKSQIYFAVCTAEKEGIIIRETSFPLENADLLIESVSRYYSYSGKLIIYTPKNDFFCAYSAAAKDIYYGHYEINQPFPGSERLSLSYINLIAD